MTYRVADGATFAASGNPGCTVAATEMTCPADADRNLTVRADVRNEQSDLTLSVTPGAPFEEVGTGHSADVTLPGRQVHDFSFTDATETAHTVLGDTDRHVVTGTVGALPTGVGSVDFALAGSGADGTAFAADQAAPCFLNTTPGSGGLVTCSVSSGDTVRLVVESTQRTQHRAVLPTDPFDEAAAGDNDQSVTLRPGTHLVLAPQQLGSLRQNAGNYQVDTTVSGVRAGLDQVRLALGGDVSLVRSLTDACAADGNALVCDDLSDGDTVSFTFSSDAARAGSVTVTATPTAPFVELYDDNTATGSLVPAYDFAMGALSLDDQTLSGDVDSYSLTSRIQALPAGLDALVFDLTEGGTFAADQVTGCAPSSPTQLRCEGLADGRDLTFAVRSSAPRTHDTTIRLQVPSGYDEPSGSPANNARTASVDPGVDLTLADLDPDNESPANDDDRHLVATRLSGVRSGVDQVTYSLTGDASFLAVDVAGCTVAPRTVTCVNPKAGDLTFTVEANDVRASTPITIEADAGAPFRELNRADNVDGVRLAPKPTYDFSMTDLKIQGQSVDADRDRYSLRTTVGAVPAGVGGLTFVVDGDSFATGQPAGCTRTDSTHVTCTGLTSPRTLDFVVDSTSGTHAVTIALQPPRAYVDPDPSDNSGSVNVTPGIDLSMSALSPANPAPAANGTYAVETRLSGVRGGQAKFAVTGATVTASTCAASSGTVTCASPTRGPDGAFTLRPTNPRANTGRRSPRGPARSSSSSTSPTTRSFAFLAPDVALTSVNVTGHRDANRQALVRVQVTGVPAGVGTVRIQLTGDNVGLGANQVHLTEGAMGADGQGSVDCFTTDGNGVPAVKRHLRHLHRGRRGDLRLVLRGHAGRAPPRQAEQRHLHRDPGRCRRGHARRQQRPHDLCRLSSSGTTSRWSSPPRVTPPEWGMKGSMTLIRLVARPMLASMFVIGGVNALRNAEGHAQKAKPVTDKLSDAAPSLPLPQDEKQLVQINGAAQVLGGLALATGRVPRLASAVLAATLIPTTAAGHRFWEESDEGARANQQIHFFKNVSMLGGLLLAAVDTEGKPGVAWRAQHAVGSARKQAKHLKREAKAQAKLAAKSVKP